MAHVVKGRGYVYSIQYHLVWCVKYRKKILTPDIEASLSEIISNIVSQNKFTIEELNFGGDHVHMLISCTPQHYIPDILKALKGVSGRLLLKAHPELKKQLWGGTSGIHRTLSLRLARTQKTRYANTSVVRKRGE